MNFIKKKRIEQLEKQIQKLEWDIENNNNNKIENLNFINACNHGYIKKLVIKLEKLKGGA